MGSFEGGFVRGDLLCAVLLIDEWLAAFLAGLPWMARAAPVFAGAPAPTGGDAQGLSAVLGHSDNPALAERECRAGRGLGQ